MAGTRLLDDTRPRHNLRPDRLAKSCCPGEIGTVQTVADPWLGCGDPDRDPIAAIIVMITVIGLPLV